MPSSWIIRRESMGSFLDPPGSPQYSYSVVEKRGGHEVSWMSLETALSEDYVPETIKDRIRKLYEQANMQCTEKWLVQVYGYFNNCYSPDGENRNVSHCLIVKPNPEGFGYVVGPLGKDGWIAELPPIENALAVLYIRKFFPNHDPRADLMANQ